MTSLALSSIKLSSSVSTVANRLPQPANILFKTPHPDSLKSSLSHRSSRSPASPVPFAAHPSGQPRRRQGRRILQLHPNQVRLAAHVVRDDHGPPAFITSFTISPHGSCRDGRTNTVARSKNRGSSDWLRNPQKRTPPNPLLCCASLQRRPLLAIPHNHQIRMRLNPRLRR